MNEPTPTGEPSLAALSRRLGGVLVFVVLVVVGIFFLQSRRNAGLEPGVDTDLGSMPRVNFVDVTEAAGITFVHNPGMRGEKLLPETMGGGVAFFDFDQDGDADLLFVNGTWWPWDVAEHPDLRPTTAALYRNDTVPGGDIVFTDVTVDSGLDVSLYGMGVACGDFDNDGLVDVYLTAVGENRLFRNLGEGRFEDATDRAGVGGGEDEWSTSVAFFDYDNDGHLDLFVCNYVEWSRALDLELNYQLPGVGRAYGPPIHFDGAFPRLFRNNGDGTFADVTAAAGLEVVNRATGRPMAKSLGVSPVDVDDDGWLDLVIANDTVQNFVFRNRRDGTFEEIGARAGLAFDAFGGTRGAMGIDAARIVEDNQLAIAIGNFANEMTALYVARERELFFSDEAIAQGIGSSTRLSLTFGLFFFDYDLDGWMDLLTVNGHIEPDIALSGSGQSYRQPAQLFWDGRGGGRSGAFVAVPDERAGTAFFQPIAGRGAAYADVDLDGDLDVVMTQIGGPPLLLRNDQSLGRKSLRVSTRGARANRDAIGTKISLRLDGRELSRVVMPTRGYLSQSELPITIGIRGRSLPGQITLRWPDGTTQFVGLSNSPTALIIEQSE